MTTRFLPHAVVLLVGVGAGWLLAGRALGELRAENPETKWPALRELIDAWNLDEEQTQKQVKFLTERELILKYGTPTENGSNEVGSHWVYGEGKDAAGQFITEVYWRIQDGYVTYVGVAER